MFDIAHSNFIQYLSNQKSTYKRYLWDLIDHDDKLIGIIGARGVGKTTYLLQYLENLDWPLKQKLYISADSLDFTNFSLVEVAREFSGFGGKVLVIDEIHKYKNFEIELKQIYDMFDLKVIFSGSSALQLEHSKVDLSRRAFLYRVNGLSYKEFLEIKLGISLRTYSLEDILENHLDISYEILKEIKPLEHWQEYLKSGFYPFYFENKRTYGLKLQETISTVIEVDIPSIFKIKYENIVNLKKLTKLICESKPYKLNMKELSSKIGIDRETLYLYMDYLNKAKIFNILRSKHKGDNIFLKPEKIYLNNSNLNYTYSKKIEIGTIRETFFANQLQDKYSVKIPNKGDFLIDDKYIVEVGGKNKSYEQIRDLPNSFLACDNIEVGIGNKIPLYLFGFMY
ncbi:MAG: ATPase component BioM of energizing module of biotin ECF transporter [uncultured Campylobacterales bacterium]|uniref:ATPase component BioM of energizing module of biotin ECF transporter n=1 Tax=uncultured Campylobacterales bacterium TaxID=352960 RepID=A0A6S6SQT3_9BACT|nr:MAG: ATPase component BioM of energizing module of biotin ECF transporter [uncultured Campylobacterales bacterium]